MPPYTLEHPSTTDIHTRFASLRERLQIPQHELARWLGVSSAHLRQIERGRQPPSGNVARLLEALETGSVRTPLLMHEPEEAPLPEPIVTLPPHALAALDLVQTDSSPAILPLRETEGAVALPPMNEEPSIADRVRAVREHFGITRPRLASWMGVSRQYITNIENGKRISAPVLKLIERLEQDIRDQKSADPAAAPVSDDTEVIEATPASSSPPPPPPLPAPEPQPIVFRPRLAAIPLLSLREAQGIDLPEHADRLALEHFAFTVGDPHAFALRLTGDAMSPQHSEGELAIVYPHSLPHTGDRVVARLKDGTGSDVVFRIYGTADHGRSIVLSSLNPAYPPITVDRDEVVWVFPIAATVRHLLG